MVAVKRAGVLCDWRERNAERREGLAVRRMGVRSGDHFGAGLVHCGVQHKGSPVERHIANDNIAVMVDQQKIARLHVAEALAERVDPEVIGQDGVTGGHMPGDAFAKAKASEDSQRAGKFCFAVSALFFEVVEGLGMECDDRLVGDGHIRTIVTNSHSI